MARKNKTAAEYARLKEKHKILAKAADRKLRALEANAKRPEYKGILNYAYKQAMKMIRKWSGGKGKMRFDKAAPNRIDQLRAKIRDIERFMSMPSSGISGVKESYKKRANTLNEIFGTSFTWNQLADFFESPEYEKGAEKFGYESYIYAIGVLQDNEKDLVKALKNNQSINLDVDDALTEKAVKGILDQYGLDFTKLYK